MADTPNNTAVWFEIPVTDLEASRRFYETVLDIKMKEDDSAINPMIAFTTMDDPGVAGHLYPGKPASAGTGISVHLAVRGTLEAARDRVAKAGGKVVSDFIPIPVGRFFYCEDLDGNSIGLFGD